MVSYGAFWAAGSQNNTAAERLVIAAPNASPPRNPSLSTDGPSRVIQIGAITGRETALS